MPRLLKLCHSAALGAALLVTSGCLTTTPSREASGTDVEPCEAIRTLTASYQQQFSDIRRARRSHNRIEIWSTPYQIVGSGCEIWAWQGGNFNYVCNYVAPDEASAREIYQEARATIKGCLAPAWSVSETPLENSNGQRTVFDKADFGGVVELRLVETRGVNTPRWAIYFMLGDENPRL